MASAQRTIVVGDIHGCYDLLLQLETMVHAYCRELNCEPFYVFVGDFVDRGPESQAVVNHVSELVVSGRAAAVMGNHDEMFLNNLMAQRPDLLRQAGYDISRFGLRISPPSEIALAVLDNWLPQGGVETLQSYHSDPYRPSTWKIPHDHLRFLLELPLVWSNEQTVVTHANASAGAIEAAMRCEDPWQLQDETRFSLLWERSAQEPATPDQRNHVSGHTPLIEPAFDPLLRRFRIDTGCVYGYALTALDPSEERIVQVPCNHKIEKEV